MSNAAILYTSDGFETSREDLMGRHSAGEGMLRGVARWLDVERYYAFVPNRASYDAFVGKMRSFGMKEDRECTQIDYHDLPGLKQVGCLFQSQPSLDSWAWTRRFFDQRDYSLCGLTHTTASDRAMNSIGAILTTPLQRWDAVICTSHSVKAMVDHLLAELGAYLGARLGATDVDPKLMLPVIPLGIHSDQFDTGERGRDRAHWRTELGIGEDDLAVLFVGRLSFHAKAHPFPMYRALELVSHRIERKVHLVQSGWFANDGIDRAFRKAAEEIAPGVAHHFVNGRDPAARFGIWHAADVFCSLSDNIQETFGLTPVEAMAAGLPVVASDWDGYRETIEDGVQGFLVPTFAPAPGLADDLAYRYATGADDYDHYLFNACGAVAVDIDATAKAFERLFTDRNLRQAMGEAGRRRAREVYDWRVIIPRYAALWQELAELRQGAEEHCPRLPGRAWHPLRDDPFALFQAYPTHRVAATSRVVALTDDMRADVVRLGALAMNRSARFPDEKTLVYLCKAFANRKAWSFAEIIDGVPASHRGSVARAVLWLKKLGLVEITLDGQGPA
jgi:alpha-maltose-1-phosphate synthase